MSLHGYTVYYHAEVNFDLYWIMWDCAMWFWREIQDKGSLGEPFYNAKVKKAFSWNTFRKGLGLPEKPTATFTVLYYDNTAQYLTYNLETISTLYKRQLYWNTP